MNHVTARPKREQVLIVLHADGHVEAFAAKTTDVRIARCPVSFNDEMAILAEDWLEQTLPWRWRHLFFPGNVRATANARSLLPSRLAKAQWIRKLIKALSEIEARKSTT